MSWWCFYMNYIKELISDILFSIKRGFQTMRGTFRANREMSKVIKRHHKLVLKMGHCGSFLYEIEQSMEHTTKEQQLTIINEFINWANHETEDWPDINPKEEPEWVDILSYRDSLEKT